MNRPETLNQLERHAIKVIRSRAGCAQRAGEASTITIKLKPRGKRLAIGWSVGWNFSSEKDDEK